MFDAVAALPLATDFAASGGSWGEVPPSCPPAGGWTLLVELRIQCGTLGLRHERLPVCEGLDIGHSRVRAAAERHDNPVGESGQALKSRIWGSRSRSRPRTMRETIRDASPGLLDRLSERRLGHNDRLVRDIVQLDIEIDARIVLVEMERLPSIAAARKEESVLTTVASGPSLTVMRA
jgi:hypothetical protein